MKATVITVTYNSARTLGDYAEGLVANADAIEHVVIVDNGSTDDTRPALDALAAELEIPLTVVASTNNGFAGGYATASSRVVGPGPVLCLNPDVALAPGVLAQMVGALTAHPEVGILTAPLLDETGAADTASVRRLPGLGTSALYAAAGRFTPRRWRYNAPTPVPDGSPLPGSVRHIEATTGALMLVNPLFRSPTSPIFDTTYWMYGEDLQLCFDAKQGGWAVGMLSTATSMHAKGASSGKPRRLRSNIAFHRAMYTYYGKNLRRSRPEALAVAGGVLGRASLSIVISSVSRGWRTARTSRRGRAAA